MGNVFKLFPYRDADNRLMFRGRIGGKIGVESKVSKFFPVRVDGRLMLRGKGPDGKILWGYPYRDSEGRLMGRTIIRSRACHIVVTLSGFPDGFGSGTCSTFDFTGLNGTHTLTLRSSGNNYLKAPADYDSLPYSGCTIAEAFPAVGTERVGPAIAVITQPSAVDISIIGKGGVSTIFCRGSTSVAGGLADHIGHTWYVQFPNFTAAVRLDAVL